MCGGVFTATMTITTTIAITITVADDWVWSLWMLKMNRRRVIMSPNSKILCILKRVARGLSRQKYD